MLIKVKNKDTLVVDDFIFKCCVGKKGLNKNKIEGDNSTPRGLFSLGKLYYRSDRVNKPETKLKIKKLNKSMGWSIDSKSRTYNSEIKINNKIKHEKLFRRDYKYDFFIPIKYNWTNSTLRKGSAIFIHLTKNFKSTAGCIALAEKDFLILVKLIKRSTKIKIL